MRAGWAAFRESPRPQPTARVRPLSSSDCLQAHTLTPPSTQYPQGSSYSRIAGRRVPTTALESLEGLLEGQVPGASWVLLNASNSREALCGGNTMQPITQSSSATVHYLAAMILKKENQTDDIHFHIFHLTQYIHNSIMSTCNLYKIIISELLPSLASSSKSSMYVRLGVHLSSDSKFLLGILVLYLIA